MGNFLQTMYLGNSFKVIRKIVVGFEQKMALFEEETSELIKDKETTFFFSTFSLVERLNLLQFVKDKL